MQNRIASLFELDELLRPGRKQKRNGTGGRKRRRKAKASLHSGTTTPTPKAEARPIAQSFDRGDPIRCQHGHAYRPAEVVEVAEPADASPEAQSVQFGADYTVESFEDSDDEEDSLLLSEDIGVDVDEEDLSISREASSPWTAPVEDAPSYIREEPVEDRELPASFAAQMNAVERDLADLATRVQNPPETEPTRVPDESGDPAGAPAPAAPQTTAGHGIFDAMAKGMSYATEFRLPPVQLSHVFSALDQELDAEEKAKAAPAAGQVPTITVPVAPGTEVVPPNEVLLKDLVTMPRKVEPAERTAPVQDVARAAAAIDVRHEVQLVPQLTGFSCWAAGAAMLVSWRDRISVDPSEIARANGYWAQYAAGLHPEDVGMFNTWRLKPEPAQSYTVAGFADLLRRHGPLWVASAEPGPHIRVVTGMVGDGTPGGTLVHINDPWEQGMAAFRTPNAGSRYTETYQRFIEKQEQLARRESRLQGIYVAHN